MDAVHMKWMARKAAKTPLLASGIIRQSLRQKARSGGCSFLLYHRVDGKLPLELDLNAALFQRQAALLAASRRVIGYEEALKRLEHPEDGDEPSYVLTFDDGYLDFYTCVFPLLKQYDLPAILFVTTGFVEEGTPYPMLSNPGVDVKPVTWDMLGEMTESGLVTLGAHTHTHPVLTGKPRPEIEEELVRPLELFERRLGLRPLHFAYPRAEADAEVRLLVALHYASAVAGGGRRAQPEEFDRHNIPRIPIRRSDGWQFFRAKLRGWLDDEEPMYDWLRAMTRRRLS
jgi:peptidoglycan/xylan/chitin deacetylase (PgdA/CDA1 family)